MFEGITSTSETDTKVNDGEQAMGNTQAQTQTSEAVDTKGEAPQGAVETDRHPLEPGGDRFNQVWARAKKAEELAAQREAQLRDAEIELARRDERLKAADRIEKAATPTDKDYSWQDLQHLVDNGQATLAQVADYREKKLTAKLKAEAVDTAVKQMEQYVTEATKRVAIQGELRRYAQSMPDAVRPGTDAFNKVVTKYQMLVQQRGHAATPETELLACELAFGDIDTVERGSKLRNTQTRETFQDTQTSGNASRPSKKLVDGLDARQKAHYARLIASNVYPDWNAVEEELKWEKPRL